MSETEQSLPEKAPILAVGGWDENHGPVGWAFGACRVALQVFSDGREPLLGGWTRAELREIWEATEARRRSR